MAAALPRLVGRLGGLGRVRRNALMQRSTRACPRVWPKGGWGRQKCCLTPAAPWDDGEHNFVSPGLQVLAAARNGCRLGLAKCRDLIAIKISLLSHLDPVAVKVLQQCVLFYLILKCILNSFIFMF